MMNKYNLFILIMALLLNACEKKDNKGVETIHWDRDVCTRCAMLVSDRHYATQTRNIKTNKNNKFDDIGCAVSWLEKNDKNWQENTNIWVKDAINMKWIDAKTALWSTKNISPMGYGLLAYTKQTSENDKNYINFNQAIKIINKKNKENKNAKHQHQ